MSNEELEELREDIFLEIKIALDNGNIEEVEKILNKNKELVDIKEVRGTWNEFHVILCHYPKEVPARSIQYLIQKGVNPILKDYGWMTPLNYAMRANNVEATKVLLQAGGDPNAIDAKGFSVPFYRGLSILPFQKDLIELFLVCGADIYLRSNYNETLLEKVNKYIDPDRKEKRDFLNHYHQELTDKGFSYFQEKWDCYLQDSEESPLHIAARRFRVQEVRELLEQGANIYAKDSLYYTPLMKALARCRLENLKEMVDIAELLPEEVSENQQAFVKRLGEWIWQYKDRFNKPQGDFAVLDNLFLQLCERFKISMEEKKAKRLPKLTEEERKLEEKHQELWKTLVPEEGKAETLQGEVIRVTGKIEEEVLNNGGNNWSVEYMDFLEATLEYFQKEHTLTPEQLMEAKKCYKKLHARGVGNKQAQGLKKLAVLWVLENEELVPLGEVHYNL